MTAPPMGTAVVEFRGGPLHKTRREVAWRGIETGVEEWLLWEGRGQPMLYERMPAEEVYGGPVIMWWIVLP